VSFLETLKRPIVGVFVDRAVIRKLNEQNFNLRSYPRLLEIAKSSAEAGVTVYYFSVNNFLDNRRRILGTYYDEKNSKWRQNEFPLPDVLYNRRAGGGQGPYRSTRIEQILDKRQVLKVNSESYFDKWEVYRDLGKNPLVNKYLPYTKKYTHERDLSEFFETHDEAYLKGVRGGRGEWILRVRKQSSGTFEYSYFTNKVVVGEVKRWKSLIRVIEKFFRGRTFVIQRAIDLIQIDKSKVDFRAEVQRDGSGELNIVGVSARIGKINSPITIHSSAYPLKHFLEEYTYYSEREIEQLIDKVRDFLISIYTALEEVYGSFGEIGIDFALDRKGRIWFIEPNSKSAKVSLMKAFDNNTFHVACANPLHYSKWLYQNAHDEEGRGR
jgi:hypothetical protein